MSAQFNKPGSSSPTKPRPSSSSRHNRAVIDIKKRVLLLEQSHVRFEPPSQRVSVFFDESNREMISLNVVDSKTKAVFSSSDSHDQLHFLLPISKRILSIKLSPKKDVLAYHVEKSNVEFINVRTDSESGGALAYALEERRYVQSTRAKNSKLLGFLWTGKLEIVMVTDLSIEFYHVDATRHRLKHVKSFQSSTNWFVYQPASGSRAPPREEKGQNDSYSVLMVSTGSLGNSIQPYVFAGSQIIKLQRFDVDGNWHGSDRLELFERSVTIASIYGFVRLLVLQHESLNVNSRGAQILVYTVDHETGTTSRTHTLDLDVSGRFAINILDDLVIAHDQPSKSSFIFDIMIESTEKSDCPKHFISLLDGQPIRSMRQHAGTEEAEMYSPNWVFFQPNFIIDAKKGLLSTLHLNLNSFKDALQDNVLFLNFLSHRKHSEQIMLDKCRDIVKESYESEINMEHRTGNPLADVSIAFELISRFIVSAEVVEKASTDSSKVQLLQSSIHREVLQQLETEQKEVSPQSLENLLLKARHVVDTIQNPTHLHFVTSTLMEYIFYVRTLDKTVDFRIYEQLLRCLLNGNRFYQLVQMIRSDIFTDSKQLACHLLSLRTRYKPAAQLGLDMLYRLGCLTDLMGSLNLNQEFTVAQSGTSQHSALLLQTIESS